MCHAVALVYNYACPTQGTILLPPGGHDVSCRDSLTAYQSWFALHFSWAQNTHLQLISCLLLSQLVHLIFFIQWMVLCSSFSLTTHFASVILTSTHFTFIFQHVSLNLVIFHSQLSFFNSTPVFQLTHKLLYVSTFVLNIITLIWRSWFFNSAEPTLVDPVRCLFYQLHSFNLVFLLLVTFEIVMATLLHNWLVSFWSGGAHTYCFHDGQWRK